eukprot:4134738-Pleurochrysis_carterae.AAC.4
MCVLTQAHASAQKACACMARVWRATAEKAVARCRDGEKGVEAAVNFAGRSAEGRRRAVRLLLAR